MELNKIPQWMLALEPEDAAFLKNFVLKSGSLKDIARLYQVSYPTVRLRLDKLIQKIELADQQEEEPFTAFIKGLAVDSRIDVETAKQIIDKYQKERQRALNHYSPPCTWQPAPARPSPCSWRWSYSSSTSGPAAAAPGTGIWAASCRWPGSSA